MKTRWWESLEFEMGFMVAACVLASLALFVSLVSLAWGAGSVQWVAHWEAHWTERGSCPDEKPEPLKRNPYNDEVMGGNNIDGAVMRFCPHTKIMEQAFESEAAARTFLDGCASPQMGEVFVIGDGTVVCTDQKIEQVGQ